MSLPCSAKCAAALLLGTITAASAPKTNILFIAVDDLRPAIGCYGDGHAITPNLDRLAKRGVRFDQAHCQVAVCNPSRASLMTGQRPDTLGVWTLPIHFREAKPNVVTLPQWLRRHGYTAVGHGKIYHNPTPDPQSWSEPIRPIKFQRCYAKGWQARIREVQAKLPDNDWRKNNLRGPATAAPVIDDHQLVDGAHTNMAIEDLRRLGQAEKPFFLALVKNPSTSPVADGALRAFQPQPRPPTRPAAHRQQNRHGNQGVRHHPARPTKPPANRGEAGRQDRN